MCLSLKGPSVCEKRLVGDAFPGRNARRLGVPALQDGRRPFAVAAKALVLPVAHDAGRLWPRNSIGKANGTIRVATFGPVIDAGAADFETVNRELEDAGLR